MEENLQEEAQESQEIQEQPVKSIQVNKNTLLVVACCLICFLLGLLLGKFIGGSSSNITPSSQQSLYQRPPLNGSSDVNSQNRFGGANGPRQGQRQRPSLQGGRQQQGGEARFQQRQQRPSQGNEARQQRRGDRERSRQFQDNSQDLGN